jgi:Antitoxin VbhA
MKAKHETTEADRRKHVETAIADSRIEGYPPPSRPEQDILDAYIRGEIGAQDLVTVYKRRQQHGALEDEESEPPAD